VECISCRSTFPVVKDGTENVGFVIGNGFAEIFETVRVLDDAGDALETHAGINMLRGQREKVPSALALNWMKTRFQISMQRASPLLTSEPPVSPAGVRSTWISEQGPQGPVSPIIQKLSFLLPLTMWTLGSRPAAVNLAAQKS
jgi:hypothetical protein